MEGDGRSDSDEGPQGKKSLAEITGKRKDPPSSSKLLLITHGGGGEHGHGIPTAPQMPAAHGRHSTVGESSAVGALALPGGSGSASLAPYIIYVEAGQDIVLRIVEFAQQRRRNVWILAGNGQINNVKIQRFPMAFTGTFHLLSLSGHIVAGADGRYSWGAGLNVVLDDEEGTTWGGVVEQLWAAEAIEVLVATGDIFAVDGDLVDNTDILAHATLADAFDAVGLPFH